MARSAEQVGVWAGRWTAVPGAALVGAAVGAATSYLQTLLPAGLSPLANSGAPWVLVALVVVMPLRRQGAAAAGLGMLVLVAEVVGYYGTALLRGFPQSRELELFWLIAALVFGALAGLAAAWLGRDDPWRRTAGIAVPAAVLIGEGAHLAFRVGGELRPYGFVEIGLGVCCLALGVLGFARTLGQRGAGAAGAIVLAAIIYAAYGTSTAL